MSSIVRRAGLSSPKNPWLVRHNHTSGRVVFSGIQPTGTPHLGNYLGALSNWTDLQRTSTKDDTLIFSVVGLHAITVPQDPGQLRRDRLDAMASLLAIGIDPARSILFRQEDVQEHAELSWILGCSAPLGRLGRMTAYKSKVASLESASNDEKLGLFAYPVLQAADILLYKATHVPVGEDQRQHLELTRDIAQMFNQRHATPTFPLPETISTPAKRVLSLRDPTQKMSKSAVNPKSRILLSDTRDEIALKIRKAVTDSDTRITYDPVGRPGISNLLRILHECRRLSATSQAPQIMPTLSSSHPSKPSSQLGLTSQYSVYGAGGQSGTPGSTPLPPRSNSQIEGSSTSSPILSLAEDQPKEFDPYHAELSELAASFQGIQTPQFKEAVVHAVDACLGPIRAELERFRADEGYVRQVAHQGAERAREIALHTMQEVKMRVGLD